MRALFLLLTIASSCRQHDRPIRVVSDDGRFDLHVAQDGSITYDGRVIGRVDLETRHLTMATGQDTGRAVDIYDGTRSDGSVIWRGPDYTLRNFGQIWSIREDRWVLLNGKRWGKCLGCDPTNSQRIRFVGAVSALARVANPAR